MRQSSPVIRNRSVALAACLLGALGALGAPACGGGKEGPSGQGGTSNTGGSTPGGGGSGTGGPSGTSGSGATDGGTGTSGSGTTGGSSGAVGDSGAGLGGATGGTGDDDAGRGGTAGEVNGGAGGVSGATDGGTTSGGQAGQGGTTGQPCGTVYDDGTPIPETARTGPMPAPMGGTVSDGTYQLSAWDVYSPASTDSDLHSATLRIALGTFELVVDGSTRQSGSVSTAGVILTFTPSCPQASPIMKPYSASATTLSLSTVSESRVETFTRQ